MDMRTSEVLYKGVQVVLKGTNFKKVTVHPKLTMLSSYTDTNGALTPKQTRQNDFYSHSLYGENKLV